MAAILIIDDDESMRSSLWHMVKRMGHQVESAATLRDGLEKASAGAFDVVLLDVSLPDGNGLDVLPDIQRTPAEPEVIIITGYGNPDSAELAIRSGAWDYIEKGTSLKAMTLHLVRALQYRQEKIASRSTSVTALKRHDIVGNSHKMRDCLDLVAQAAAGDTSVMITGETGTGKELFARAIHNNSRRAGGNFVVVDCAALPETLVESLLFGHEKGTFTGAEKAREGLIQQAHGGPSSWTRWASFPSRSRRHSCGFSRSAGSAPLAASANWRAISASSPPPTGISTRWCATAVSATTCCSGSVRSPSSCRRSGSGRRISRSWPVTTWTGSASAMDWLPKGLRRNSWTP